MERADRKYLGWTVALFALLGLVGLGTVLYRPLRLRYAIYRAEQDSYLPPISHAGSRRPDKWLLLCLDAATHGNERAMEVVVNRWWVGRWEPSTGKASYKRVSIAFSAARAQPQLFLRVLERADDQKVLATLEAITSTDVGFVAWTGGGVVYVPTGVNQPKALLTELDALAKSDNPETARLAVAAAEFLSRRFAKELAEAEKAEKAAPKPKKPKP